MTLPSHDVLYHGTLAANTQSIVAHGLIGPTKARGHWVQSVGEVWLTPSRAIAAEYAGSRANCLRRRERKEWRARGDASTAAHAAFVRRYYEHRGLVLTVRVPAGSGSPCEHRIGIGSVGARCFDYIPQAWIIGWDELTSYAAEAA